MRPRPPPGPGCRPASTPRSARRSAPPGPRRRAPRSSVSPVERPAADQQPRAAVETRPGVEQAPQLGRDERDHRHARPLAASAAATASTSKRAWIRAAVPYRTERIRIVSPPTWSIGMQQSQTSSGSTPRLAAEAAAEAAKFAKLRSTGRRAPVVPLAQDPGERGVGPRRLRQRAAPGSAGGSHLIGAENAPGLPRPGAPRRALAGGRPGPDRERRPPGEHRRVQGDRVRRGPGSISIPIARRLSPSASSSGERRGPSEQLGVGEPRYRRA